MSDLVKRLEALEAWLMANDVDMRMPEGMSVPTEQARLLEQQLKTAREALEPFAEEGNSVRFGPVSDHVEIGLTKITIGDLRRAAAAIRSLGEKE